MRADLRRRIASRRRRQKLTAGSSADRRQATRPTDGVAWQNRHSAPRWRDGFLEIAPLALQHAGSAGKNSADRVDKVAFKQVQQHRWVLIALEVLVAWFISLHFGRIPFG